MEVWFDEFSLSVGDSLRRSIDKGLRQSRFGIVVLSHSFFAKNWPQYELDGLVDREMSGDAKVILPVWHEVNHTEVSRYSPSIAGRVAASTSDGIDALASTLLQVIRPDRSPLLIARDIALEWGLNPPVITDSYWLDVAEASNRIPGTGAVIPEESHWARWSFPLPSRNGSDPDAWGERLAWTALQLQWVNAADSLRVDVTTRPELVHAFILEHPGLLDICEAYPTLAADYAPQLTLRGFGGPLEKLFERQYLASLVVHSDKRSSHSLEGTALTTDKKLPRCDTEWALRDPLLGNYEAVYLASHYFNGDSPFGPTVSLHEDFDHAVWLIATESEWLPPHIRATLISGMRVRRPIWVWGIRDSHAEFDREPWSHYGALQSALYGKTGPTHFRWTKAIAEDVMGRICVSRDRIGLSESAEVLFRKFTNAGFGKRLISRERSKRNSRKK